jgi:hypothetical protein
MTLPLDLGRVKARLLELGFSQRQSGKKVAMCQLRC